MSRVIAFAHSGLTVDDIDVFEINEAFASQVTDWIFLDLPKLFQYFAFIHTINLFTIFLGCVLCGKTGHSYGKSES